MGLLGKGSKISERVLIAGEELHRGDMVYIRTYGDPKVSWVFRVREEAYKPDICDYKEERVT